MHEQENWPNGTGIPGEPSAEAVRWTEAEVSKD